MRGSAVAALVLIVGCGGRGPTLDTEEVALDLRTCCCATPVPTPVFEHLGHGVCASVGGACTEDAPCVAFAAEPCCCITFRDDGQRRVKPTTWGECLEPGTCHPGDCGSHR